MTRRSSFHGRPPFRLRECSGSHTFRRFHTSSGMSVNSAFISSRDHVEMPSASFQQVVGARSKVRKTVEALRVLPDTIGTYVEAEVRRAAEQRRRSWSTFYSTPIR